MVGGSALNSMATKAKLAQVPGKRTRESQRSDRYAPLPHLSAGIEPSSAWTLGFWVSDLPVTQASQISEHISTVAKGAVTTMRQEVMEHVGTMMVEGLTLVAWKVDRGSSHGCKCPPASVGPAGQRVGCSSSSGGVQVPEFQTPFSCWKPRKPGWLAPGLPSRLEA